MRNPLFNPLLLASLVTCTGLSLAAADAKDAKKEKPAAKAKPTGTQWDTMDLGPFFSGGIQVPGEKGDVFRPALKGVTINLGNAAAMCFDTERLRMAIGWHGGFLKLPAGREGLEGVASPVGEVAFKSVMIPGWADARGSFKEPKPPVKEGKELVSFGPLPRDWAKWRGLYVHGSQIILSYTLGKVGVLELPGYDAASRAFTRTIHFEGAAHAQKLLLASDTKLKAAHSLAGATLETTADGLLVLNLPALTQATTFVVALSASGALPQVGAANLPALTKGGKAQWTPVLETAGITGKSASPYAVDTLTLPDGKANPWNSWIRTSGFDFFKDGTTAAICSVSGDVWIVSGIDESLAKLKWKRFATGLFQPLGLKIVDGKVHVLGRDQITRLHDLNGDGEADFYENFNNDIAISSHYHEFNLGLETDRAGNFYFNKGGDLGGAKHQHHGVLARVSKDGSRLDVVATGYRAPNGLGVGPNDELTSSDNEGNWVPSSRVNLMKPGGFYGHVFTSHTSTPPTDYDKPLFWLPHQVDNSSGGQVWVTSDKWGPFKGDMLHMSYGSCSLFKVMKEEVGGQVQGGAVRFDLSFESGIMRGRFNARDGQLYVTGLRVWQSSGAKTGAFHRVRYTGKPVAMPKELHVKPTGIEITFTSALDAKTAADDGNWAIDQWNYKWKSDYGSKMYSASEPDKIIGENKIANSKFGGEDLNVKSAKLLADKKTVFLEVEGGVKPVMQMRIRMNINAADGTPINQTIYNTVNKVAGK
ncbi:MAG: hypothetical protein HZA92_13595 [Verrucomicrobia bacterium]|nr:hypothetical protein [Verrucomicrobiota bacterium]